MLHTYHDRPQTRRRIVQNGLGRPLRGLLGEAGLSNFFVIKLHVDVGLGWRRAVETAVALTNLVAAFGPLETRGKAVTQIGGVHGR